MIVDFLKSLGAWSWIFAGVVFLIIEVTAPGVLFLWLSIGALLVGAITLLAALLGVDLHLYVQLLAFAAISTIAAIWGRQLYAAKRAQSDEPLLNKRFDQFIGQTVALDKPIKNGKGRIKLGDTVWRVVGPDSAAGVRMVITGEQDGALVLEYPAA